MLIFTVIDYVILSVVIMSGVVSLFRGFIKEALSLLLWVLAFSLTLSFNDMVSDYLVDVISLPPIRFAVATAGLFFVIMFIGSMLNQIISTLIKTSGLGAFDRMLGLFFGVARGVLIMLAVVIMTPYIVDIENAEWWTASVLVPYLLEFESHGMESLAWVTELLISWVF